MERIRLKANCKLNLSLDITGVREDGYHIIDSVMHSIDLCDELLLKKTRGGISIRTNRRYLPTDGRNHAHKAAMALARYVGAQEFGVEIHIGKRVPTQAGLGGGSADAAAVLVGINELFSLRFSLEELMRVGEGVGADVPFCVKGGAARVGGVGELIAPISPLSGIPLVIAMPRYGSSTKEAFARYDAGATLIRPNTTAMLAAVATGDAAAIGINAKNVFEQLVDGPDTQKLKDAMLSHGAFGASLTGSGAAVFGVFGCEADAQACREKLAHDTRLCAVAYPAAAGVEII